MSELIYLLNLAESTPFAGVIVSMLSSWKGIIPTDSSNTYYKTSPTAVLHYFCYLSTASSTYRTLITESDSLKYHYSQMTCDYFMVCDCDYHTGYRKDPKTNTTFLPRPRKSFVMKLSLRRSRSDLYRFLTNFFIWAVVASCLAEHSAEIYDPCHSVFIVYSCGSLSGVVIAQTWKCRLMNILSDVSSGIQFPVQERPLNLCIRGARIRVRMQFVYGVYVILCVKYFQMLIINLILCVHIQWVLAPAQSKDWGRKQEGTGSVHRISGGYTEEFSNRGLVPHTAHLPLPNEDPLVLRRETPQFHTYQQPWLKVTSITRKCEVLDNKANTDKSMPLPIHQIRASASPYYTRMTHQVITTHPPVYSNIITSLSGDPLSCHFTLSTTIIANEKATLPTMMSTCG
jgi:hypothetical protein